jgi:hypothetical protein
LAWLARDIAEPNNVPDCHRHDPGALVARGL